MSKYTADIRILVTVEFEDDGEFSLKDQALDRLEDTWSSVSSMLSDANYEIVGHPIKLEDA